MTRDNNSDSSNGFHTEYTDSFMYQSIPSLTIPPPPGQNPWRIFGKGKFPFPWAQRKCKTPTPGAEKSC